MPNFFLKDPNLPWKIKTETRALGMSETTAKFNKLWISDYSPFYNTEREEKSNLVKYVLNIFTKKLLKLKSF